MKQPGAGQWAIADDVPAENLIRARSPASDGLMVGPLGAMKA